MGSVNKTNVDFLRQMAFRGKINYRFRKSALDFLLVIHYNYWCIFRTYKVTQHFRTFSFGWDFPTGTVLGDFEPLKVDFNFSDTQKTHPYAKPRLFEPSYDKSRRELWSVGELTKQEEAE